MTIFLSLPKALHVDIYPEMFSINSWHWQESIKPFPGRNMENLQGKNTGTEKKEKAVQKTVQTIKETKTPSKEGVLSDI